MTPSQLRGKVVAERVAWIKRMLTHLRELSLDSYDTFRSDPRNIAAAESYLRRALEALLDLGRHIVAKGFGVGVAEYKDIATNLAQFGVLDEEGRKLLREMAGYRNRLVHFYQEISDRELYEISTRRLNDIETALAAMTDWIKSHPEMIDQSL